MNQETQNPRVLCLRLKNMRENACISVSKMAKETGIAPSHIKALEACEYEKLPTGSARRTIVKQYANALKINEQTLSVYFDELKTNSHTHKKTKRFSIHALPTKLRFITTTLMISALLGYLGWEIQGMIGPPKLVIDYPSVNHETHISHITVTGQTNPETQVTINGLITNITTTGVFDEKVHLKEGVNDITIIAESKRGGKTQESRSILYTPDTSKAASGPIDTPQL